MTQTVTPRAGGPPANGRGVAAANVTSSPSSESTVELDSARSELEGHRRAAAAAVTVTRDGGAGGGTVTVTVRRREHRDSDMSALAWPPCPPEDRPGPGSQAQLPSTGRLPVSECQCGRGSVTGPTRLPVM